MLEKKSLRFFSASYYNIYIYIKTQKGKTKLSSKNTSNAMSHKPTHHHPPSEFPKKTAKWWFFPELFFY